MASVKNDDSISRDATRSGRRALSEFDQEGVIEAFSSRPPTSRLSAVAEAERPTLEVDGLKQFLRMLNRGRSAIVLSVLVCLIFALTYLVLAPPRYVGQAIMLVEPPSVEAQPTNLTRPIQSYVGSQIQVLQSDAVALFVARNLKLTDPKKLEADTTRFPLLRRLKQSLALWLLNEPPGSQATDADELAVASLKQNLVVQLVGIDTQVIAVSYKSVDPLRAANVANAFFAAYTEYIYQRQKDRRANDIESLQQQLISAGRRAGNAELALDEFKAQGIVESAGRYRTRLKELQSTANSLRQRYEDLLRRSIEASQDRDVPSASATLLERARVPSDRSEPNDFLVFTFAILIGLTVGIALVLVSDYASDDIGFADELKTLLHMPVFGEFPTVEPTRQITTANVSAKLCAKLEGAACLVLDEPLSEAADLLRITQAAIDKRVKTGFPMIFGVTSTVEGEGRSTICQNLAHLAAAAGRSVLLVDADWRYRSLTRTLATDRTPGLAQILSGDAAYGEVVWRDVVSGARFLPVGSGLPGLDHPEKALATAARFTSTDVFMAVTEISKGHDCTIVCLPPLTTPFDTGAAAESLDGFLLVVQAECTPRRAIASALEAAGEVSNKTFGAVLNRRTREFGAIRRLAFGLLPPYRRGDRNRGRAGTDTVRMA